MGSFRKLTLFNLGNVWDFVEKALNFNVFTHIFGIFGLWIHFSFKYIKTIVKGHQMAKLEKKLPCGLVQG